MRFLTLILILWSFCEISHSCECKGRCELVFTYSVVDWVRDNMRTSRYLDTRFHSLEIRTLPPTDRKKVGDDLIKFMSSEMISDLRAGPHPPKHLIKGYLEDKGLKENVHFYFVPRKIEENKSIPVKKIR